MAVIYDLKRGTVILGTAEDAYQRLRETGERPTLCHSDGPYALNIAEWDPRRPDMLPAWYAPHMDAWTELLADSASVYVWGTDEGLGYLREPMRERGWTYRGRVTWNKGPGGSRAMRSAPDTIRGWPDVTECFELYQRNAWEIDTTAGQQIAYAAGADERNWIRLWLRDEWTAAGLRSKDADACLGTNGMAGHYFGRSQWSLPTWEHYQTLAATAAEHGPPRQRPYLVHPSCWPVVAAGDHLRASYDHLRAEYDHLRAEYDHLRAEYEAARVAFNCPPGVTNVWAAPMVSGGPRLRGQDGDTLHPCQKRADHVRRIVLASSRPGDLILEPFGGTLRVAAVCEALPEQEARRYLVSEPEARYVEAVLPLLSADHGRPLDELPLFGGL